MFYNIISTTYQKVGDLFCPIYKFWILARCVNQLYIELGPKCFLDKSFQVRHFVDILYCDGFAGIIPNNLNNFFVNFVLESNKIMFETNFM